MEPFNAIWSGLGLVILFFLPMLALACGLEGLYKRSAQRFGDDNALMAVKNKRKEGQYVKISKKNTD